VEVMPPPREKEVDTMRLLEVEVMRLLE